MPCCPMTQFNHTNVRRWAFEEMRYEVPRPVLHPGDVVSVDGPVARAQPTAPSDRTLTVARVGDETRVDAPGRVGVLKVRKFSFLTR